MLTAVNLLILFKRTRLAYPLKISENATSRENRKKRWLDVFRQLASGTIQFNVSSSVKPIWIWCIDGSQVHKQKQRDFCCWFGHRRRFPLEESDEPSIFIKLPPFSRQRLWNEKMDYQDWKAPEAWRICDESLWIREETRTLEDALRTLFKACLARKRTSLQMVTQRCDSSTIGGTKNIARKSKKCWDENHNHVTLKLAFCGIHAIHRFIPN